MTSSDSSGASSPTNASLLASIRLGAGPAWEKLVRYYQPRMEAWCRTNGISPSEVPDVMQECWISVSRSVTKFQSEPGHGAFRAWLFRIVQYRIADRKRKTYREVQGTGGSTMVLRLNQVPNANEFESSSAELDSSMNPSCISLKRWAEQDQVRECMKRVSAHIEPRTWLAFERCVIDGMETDAVANELGMTAANVRQARSRVLRKIRAELGV